MKTNDLVENVGMQFDEAMELFSGETLETMAMSHVVGGDDTYIQPGSPCQVVQNDQCACNPTTTPTSTSTSTSTPTPCGCGC